MHLLFSLSPPPPPPPPPLCLCILILIFCCNSALSGLSLSSLNQLQKIQNNAARHVPCKWKSDHVTPLLEKVHWLPVDAYICYKVATLDFRHFQNSIPPYLLKLLHTYQPSWTLRSSSEILLKVPKINLKSAGNRSFHFLHLFFFQTKPERTLLSWFVKHLFCTVWLLIGCMYVQEVALIW